MTKLRFFRMYGKNCAENTNVVFTKRKHFVLKYFIISKITISKLDDWQRLVLRDAPTIICAHLVTRLRKWNNNYERIDNFGHFDLLLAPKTEGMCSRAFLTSRVVHSLSAVRHAHKNKGTRGHHTHAQLPKQLRVL